MRMTSTDVDGENLDEGEPTVAGDKQLDEADDEKDHFQDVMDDDQELG